MSTKQPSLITNILTGAYSTVTQIHQTISASSTSHMTTSSSCTATEMLSTTQPATEMSTTQPASETFAQASLITNILTGAYSTVTQIYQSISENSTSHTTTSASSTTSFQTTDNGSTANNTSFQTTDNGSTANNGLIIGLSVGIPCGVLLIAAIGLTVFCFCRKKKTPQNTSHLARTDSNQYEVSIQSPSRNHAVYDDVDVLPKAPMYEKVIHNFEPEYATTIALD